MGHAEREERAGERIFMNQVELQNFSDRLWSIFVNLGRFLKDSSEIQALRTFRIIGSVSDQNLTVRIDSRKNC